MKPQEIAKLQAYMRKTFKSSSVEVRARPRKSDSAEVYVGEEFIGVIHKDEDDDEDYSFTMAILAVDLD